MTNKEAIDQIVKLCNTLQILPNTSLGKAMIRALDCLDAWDKVLEELKTTCVTTVECADMITLMEKHLKEVI